MKEPAFLRTARRYIVGDPMRPDVVPPKPAPGRHGLGVALIAKDEARHVRDWLIFHRLAGVRRAIIYDNGSTDGMADIARGVADMEVVVVPWVTDISVGALHLKPQPLAYAHAICTFGADLRWMSFLDIDEYLVPLDGQGLLPALDALGGVTNVSLPWAMFGTGGHVTAPDEPAVYAYRERARERRPEFTNYKLIVDPCDVVRITPHKAWTRSMGAASANDAGAIAKTYKAREGEFVSAARIQLNHYYTFSEEELARKMARSAVSQRDAAERASGVARVRGQIESDTVRDDSAPDFLSRCGVPDAAAFRALR